MSSETPRRSPSGSLVGAERPPAPVVSLNGQVLAAALRRDPNPKPQLALRMAHGEALRGTVVLQILTTEGPLLLEAEAHPGRGDGVARLELAPLEPSVRAWLQEQVQ